ncbi:hypothetical protein M5689_012133 [Euphorbia peplus]|nr:hypothetical protein M5689_012133 [Euphorbia peplus]
MAGAPVRRFSSLLLGVRPPPTACNVAGKIPAVRSQIPPGLLPRPGYLVRKNLTWVLGGFSIIMFAFHDYGFSFVDSS